MEAMELVTGGDLLSSLTGEPQLYEDATGLSDLLGCNSESTISHLLC